MSDAFPAEKMPALPVLANALPASQLIPLDRFDDDSGWWIAASLKGFVDRWRDPYFSESAWTVLSSRPH